MKMHKYLAALPHRAPGYEVPRPPTPDYTGYGSWDDSMASVMNLIPKAPRKDFHKLMSPRGCLSSSSRTNFDYLVLV